MCLHILMIYVLLIVCKRISEHMQHVQKVLQQLVELRLKPRKCTFATTEIQYLGHTFTPKGIKSNDSKITAVNDFLKPQIVKQVNSFLGLANFYRRHVPRMAAISRPLTDLTRKDSKEFVWT